MSANALPLPLRPTSSRLFCLRCNSRWIVLTVLGLLIGGIFWVGSRYPALLAKASHTNGPLASMAYSNEVFSIDPKHSIAIRIALSSLNWLSSMAIGMTFGLSFGALLHTALRYYPLRIGQNLTLNTLKGALVGIPMGVCANCAVPMACGLTRGQGRVEVALGYLFSSPNFNPVVVAITFSILPWYFGVVKYAVLLLVILLFVPRLIQFLENKGRLRPTLSKVLPSTCAFNLSIQPCDRSFGDSAQEIVAEFGKNLWMLFKPTISLMLRASILASTLLILVPWQALFSVVGAGRMLLASLLSVFMPVPIALDVMFAGELNRTGVNPGYCMMLLMTLGTYSVIPAVYLWREVSRTVSIVLFALFLIFGSGLGLLFSLIA